MAKTRVINTELWTDRWVRSINPLDRLLFVYLLSNSHTNISGVYELSDDVMAFEVGLNIKDIHDAFLPRLAPKVLYKDGWVIIPKFPKHQNLESKDVVKGIWREFYSAPEHVQRVALEGGWGEGLGMVGGGSLDHPLLNLTKLNLTKPNGGEAVASQSLEEWLADNGYKEVEMYLGEEEGEGVGYKHPSRKTAYSLKEVEKLYSKAVAPSVARHKAIRDEFHYDFDRWLERLRISPQKTDKIVALIWKEKGYRFENYEQWKAQFDQDKKYAAQLKGYSGSQVMETIEACKREAAEKNYEWKASTVAKKIAQVVAT